MTYIMLRLNNFVPLSYFLGDGETTKPKTKRLLQFPHTFQIGKGIVNKSVSLNINWNLLSTAEE